MFWTNAKRIIKTGFVSFWRNGFVSFASVVVMTITLSAIGFIIFIGAILGASLAQLEDKVDVNVYFYTTAQEADILTLKGNLEELNEVASVEYVSREDALVLFRERHQNDSLTLQALDELGDNPLGAILNIKAQETSQYETVAAFLEGEEALGAGGVPIIERVNFFENQAAIERLTQVIDATEALGYAIAAVFAVISIIITFTTIRLAIYTNREEIGVMRLVGASNRYIRGPFVIEGILYGLVSGLITLAVYYPLTLWLGPITERFFGSINVFDYYIVHFGELFIIIVISGIILGALSSYLAVRRYLKV